MKKIEIVIERTRTGYSAYVANFPVATTGKTLSVLKENILEALNLFFEEKKKKILEKDLKLKLDLEQFFEFYKIINAKALSERIGMHQSLLAQYAKGIKKPSASQAERILRGIHSLGKELSEIRFLL